MKVKKILSAFLGTVALLCITLSATAQAYQVKGTVYDTNGTSPLVGVTITIKGTTVGTSTDVHGKYSINAKDALSILVFQSLGYDNQEFQVGSRTLIDVVMNEASTNIEGVVVTALGITRAEKSIGYAVQKVSGDALVQTVSSNWVTNLNGKVAGLSMTSAGTGPGGTQRVVLRGDASLNYGKNEVLYVIDGVPILSGTTASGSAANYDNQNAPVDYGNAVSDINPDDIESVSVLKGPSATALYGSRAANGAIVITTKKGRTEQGWGVTLNASVSFEDAMRHPDFQTEYGPSAITTSLTNYNASAWGLPGSMTYNGQPTQKLISRYAYGAKFDPNKLAYLYQSKNWDTGEFTPVPWVYAEDWFTGIYRTGVTYNTSVTVDGNSGKGTSARFSFTDSRDDWIMENTGYNRQNYSISLTHELNKHITLNAKANYSRRKSDNMPVGGYGASSPIYGLIWGYNAYPMSSYRDEQSQGRYTMENYLAGANSNPYDIQSSLVYNSLEGHNPYRVLYENLNTLVRDRAYGNISLDAKILPGLILTLRGGMDMNNDFRTQQRPKMTAGYANGMYREQTMREFEFNMDFLLRYQKTFSNSFSVMAGFGGNDMRHSYYNSTISADELDVEGPSMYTLANSAVPLNPSSTRNRKAIQSLYGFLNLGFKDAYYLDITGRNDWSSTLHPSKWSYFYPSVSASVLIDKAIGFKVNAIDMIKVRASWSNVGNDTGSYSLYDAYSNSDFPGGFVLPTTLADAYINPENIEAWEAGLEARFFKNRLGVDIALYRSSTTNQIISATQSAEVGATGIRMNAGEILNKGIEISLNATPIKLRDFSWDISMNWAKNINKLVALTDDWDPNQPFQTSNGTTIGSRVYIYSYIGQAMHQIYGSDYLRAPEGSTYTDENGKVVDCSGMKIINASTGMPSINKNENVHIGQVNPDWRGGFSTTFRYKTLSLSANFTAQMGGNSYSVTNFALSYQGKLKNSLPGRPDGLVVGGVNVVEKDGVTTYQPNTTITNNVNDYYNTVKWVRDNVKENTFSTDFFKLKELRLDYQIPKRWIKATRVLQGASVGVFATNVFCITDWPQYDPEAAGSVNGSNIFGGIETGTFPMTRTLGFNVKLQF